VIGKIAHNRCLEAWSSLNLTPEGIRQPEAMPRGKDVHLGAFATSAPAYNLFPYWL
jgi:hypothetical protein